MKNIGIGLGIGISLFFVGCINVAHVGKGSYVADSTFGSTNAVFDKKKVKYFLKRFKKETISKPIAKSLNAKDVVVFNSSVPSDCKKIGYIVVEDYSGKNTKKLDFQLAAKKAAKYGVKAISNRIYANMTNIKTEYYTLETKNPYESISYIKIGDTLDGYIMTYKRDSKLDAKCKKTKNYFQCIRKEVTRHAPEKNIRFLHAVTALQCSDTTLKKYKAGQTVMSINIENKFK